MSLLTELIHVLIGVAIKISLLRSCCVRTALSGAHRFRILLFGPFSLFPLRPPRPLREALSSFDCDLRALGLAQGSVGQGPEIAEHFRWFRRVHHALGEKDADHILGWIDVGRGAGAAVPTESAGVMG